MAVRLHLTHMPEIDRLVALEYGRVDEGQPRGCWRPVGTELGYLHDGPLGPEVGFKVLSFTGLDVDADEVAEIWGPPFFDVPMLGLSAASAGEVIVAARALFDGYASIDHWFYARAAAASGEEAVDLWLACLEAGGGGIAHCALGYTLFELGRYHEAYRHARYYTELAPLSSWAWCCYGRAADALAARRGAPRVCEGDRDPGRRRPGDRRPRAPGTARSALPTAAPAPALALALSDALSRSREWVG